VQIDYKWALGAIAIPAAGYLMKRWIEGRAAKTPLASQTAMSPGRVLRVFNDSPLLMRDETAKRLIGVPVEFKGELVAAKQQGDQLVAVLNCDPIDVALGLVHFAVDQREYPGFGLLTKGHRIRGRGKVALVEWDCVTLTEVKLAGLNL
jgi:hypothetical protein